MKTSLALAVALALLGLVGCTTEPSNGKRSSTQDVASPSVSGSASNERCRYGPWADHCSEADWARAALQNAGYRFTGDTGSALEARHDRLIFHFWAFTPEGSQKRPLGRALADENYREIKDTISGITVYTDGRRFAWSVHGLWAWLTWAAFVKATPGGTADEIREGVLEDLVVATKRTPFVSH